MWTLEKEFKFEAAHTLPCSDGKCKNLHGHSWVGKIIVEGETLITDGSDHSMLIDFHKIKDAIDPIVEEFLDHKHLNKTLDLESPTSEMIAKWIFDRLYLQLKGLRAVEIYETATSKCRYER